MMPGQPSFDLSFHDYHRTVIAYHGTTKDIADRLVDGGPFHPSNNDDDWLGSGMYFWEYAPKQAWWWATQYKKNPHPAVVGAVIRLGNCFDLLDPANVDALRHMHADMMNVWPAGTKRPENGNQHKKLDCAVFNFLYNQKNDIQTARAVYVPTQAKDRVWSRSWIYAQSHIQICVRKQENILALWHVRKDGRYGKDV